MPKLLQRSQHKFLFIRRLKWTLNTWMPWSLMLTELIQDGQQFTVFSCPDSGLQNSSIGDNLIDPSPFRHLMRRHDRTYKNTKTKTRTTHWDTFWEPTDNCQEPTEQQTYQELRINVPMIAPLGKAPFTISSVFGIWFRGPCSMKHTFLAQFVWSSFWFFCCNLLLSIHT